MGPNNQVANYVIPRDIRNPVSVTPFPTENKRMCYANVSLTNVLKTIYIGDILL